MVQGDGPIPTGRAHSRIYRRAIIVEIFDELESQQIAIETDGAPYILNVDHSVVEGKLPADTQVDGYLSSCRPALLDNDVWTEYICTENEDPETYKNINQKDKDQYEKGGKTQQGAPTFGP